MVKNFKNFKNFKNCQNCQNFWKISKNFKILVHFENFDNFWNFWNFLPNCFLNIFTQFLFTAASSCKTKFYLFYRRNRIWDYLDKRNFELERPNTKSLSWCSLVKVWMKFHDLYIFGKIKSSYSRFSVWGWVLQKKWTVA